MTDGIANCPNGEDQSLSECSATYSSLATVECSKINIYNLNITIKAVLKTTKICSLYKKWVNHLLVEIFEKGKNFPVTRRTPLHWGAVQKNSEFATASL